MIIECSWNVYSFEDIKKFRIKWTQENVKIRGESRAKKNLAKCRNAIPECKK